jgi:hypothetical protein
MTAAVEASAGLFEKSGPAFSKKPGLRATYTEPPRFFERQHSKTHLLCFMTPSQPVL